ncbi:efflux RND transporter periplasmic adaptor subunit [Pseudomonas sp. XS1P51]
MIINEASQPIRRSCKLRAGIGVALLVVSGIAVDRFQASGTCQPNAEQWVSVQSELLVHKIGLVGKIEPHRNVILTAPFEGNVQAKLVEPGQRVEKGQTMLSMDPAFIQIELRDALSAQLKARRAVQEFNDWTNSASVARARRTLRTSELSMNNLQRAFRDSQTLFDRGIIARNELDDLNQQIQTQKLELLAAQSELQQILEQGQGEYRQIAEMELKNASVRYETLLTLLDDQHVLAPFTGVVVPAGTSQPSGTNSTGPVQAGARVGRGQVLFGLANINELKIATSVSELDVNKLHPGQEVEILGDGFEGDLLRGTVRTVGSVAERDEESSGSATFSVTLSIPELTHEQSQRVRLGMSTRLTIITYRNDEAIILPPEAILLEGQDRIVEYREGVDQPIKRMPVTTGRSTLKGIEVFGLSPGLVRLQIQAPCA